MQLIFSTDDVHPRDRLAYWRDVGIAKWCQLDRRVDGPSNFRAQIHGTSLGPLNLMLVEAEPCEIAHRNAGPLASDDVLVILQLDGSWLGAVGERQMQLRPGELAIVDPQRPYNVKIEPGFRQLVVKVPRFLLEARLGSIARFSLQKLPADAPVGSLTFDLLKMLPSCAASLSDIAAQHIVNQVLELLTVAYTRDENQSSTIQTSTRMAALLRLKSEIENRLFDSSMTAEDYAAKAGMSARYANKLLEAEDTTLQRYIFARRLDKSRAALDDADFDDRSVSEIAHAHGFSTASHFTRKFKEAFGTTPAEYRRRHR